MPELVCRCPTCSQRVTFTDVSGREHVVRADAIIHIAKPTYRVHDHGSLTLSTGKTFDFATDDTAGDVLRQLDRADVQYDGGY